LRGEDERGMKGMGGEGKVRKLGKGRAIGVHEGS